MHVLEDSDTKRVVGLQAEDLGVGKPGLALAVCVESFKLQTAFEVKQVKLEFIGGVARGEPVDDAQQQV